MNTEWNVVSENYSDLEETLGNLSRDGWHTFNTMLSRKPAEDSDPTTEMQFVIVAFKEH